MRSKHDMPFGAQLLDDGSVRFRLWAPAAKTIELCIESPGEQACISMNQVENGWYEIITNQAQAGTLYRYAIDNGLRVPDPASRYNARDVEGPSVVIDPLCWEWKDDDWNGRSWEETVIYEMHIGTFTTEGTFSGAIEKLDYLKDLGITAIEIMPIADFPGKRNWGYDGVLLFAPESSYGTPEELKEFIQRAHEKNLMVFLDVVYNHFGPEGNYLHTYAPQFFTDRHHTPWGAAINYDGPNSREVRSFYLHNALYWLEEYHFDGLRLDAVHSIVDDSHPTILQELAEAIHRGPAAQRHIHLIVENDKNDSDLLKCKDEHKPCWYSGQWNDDVHHALHVLITQQIDGYYVDYAEKPAQHLARALAEGFSYQGDHSQHRNNEPRGKPSAQLPPTAFIPFLQNHDQVGNNAFGDRITRQATEDAIRAAIATLLLAPSIPLMFMGEEFAADQPFPFFCDFGPTLAGLVTAGRRKEFERFPAFRDPKAQLLIPDPSLEQTFRSAILDWTCLQWPKHTALLNFYRRLLHIRHTKIVPKIRDIISGKGSYQLVDDRCIKVRWPFKNDGALVIVANFSNGCINSESMNNHHDAVFTFPEFSAHDLYAGRLVPWSVLCYLEHQK